MKLIPSVLFTVISLSAVGVTSAFADVTASKSSGAISFQDATGMYNGTLNVSGPDGFQSQSFSENGLPGFTVQGAGALADGLYSYSLSAATRDKEGVDTSLDNGRGDDAPGQTAVSYSTSGTFRISNGQIVVNEAEAASLFGQDPGE